MEYYRIICDYENGFNNERLFFKDEIYGVPSINEIVSSKEEFHFICPYSKSHLLDMPSNCGNYFLVSEDLLQILMKYSKDIESKKVSIIDRNSTTTSNYYLIHIMNGVKALDKERSLYFEFQEQHRRECVISIDDCVLKGMKLKNRHFFRVEGLQDYYFVSDKLKKELEENNISGIDFKHVEVY